MGFPFKKDGGRVILLGKGFEFPIRVTGRSRLVVLGIWRRRKLNC